MKIAWFSPFNKRSAIAKVSKLIVEHLSQNHAVDLWVHEPESEWLDTQVKKVRYHFDSTDMDIKDYDFVVYNYGNNHIFHGPIYEMSRRYPGIAILHDYTLHIFFEEWYKMQGSPQAYISLVEQYYGAEAAKLAKKSIDGEMTPTLSRSDSFVQMPLFEPALDSMLGYFLHSKFSHDIIKSKFLGPAHYSYLPFPLEKLETVDKKELRQRMELPDDKIIIVSTGIVHPVKRVEHFLRGWGKAKNKHSFYYCVIGEYGEEYFKTLNQIATEYGLQNSIRYLGWTSEAVLTNYLDAGDIAVNLRYPNSEGCSYSAVEQLAHGLPVICNNSGFYSELPDEISFRISLKTEEQELIQTLESMTNLDALLEKSQKAKAFAQKNFSVATYCKNLENFLNGIKGQQESNYLYNRYFSWVSEQINNLFSKNEQSIVSHVNDLLSFTPKPASKSGSKVLGVWFGFPYPVGLRREGITRFAVSFVTALIEAYDYDIEVWCYDVNKEELEISFSTILDNPKTSSKISIVTEKNYPEKFGLTSMFAPPQIKDSWNLSYQEDNLHLPANKYSKADAFLVSIIYLANAAQINRKLIVAAHDLQPLVDYESFVNKDKNQIYYIRKIFETGNTFVKKDAIFFSNSKFVLETQIKHFLTGVSDKNGKYIYLPGNFPKFEQAPEDPILFRERFQLKKPYLFLATQFRPYKNLILLLKACLLNPEILNQWDLIFTGNLDDDPTAKTLVEQTDLKKCVRTVGPLTEQDLRNFYLNCDFVVVPTLFEGGFPWQAIEAMNYRKPVLMSDIPITSERLKYESFFEKSTSFMLFDPKSPEDLNEKMKALLLDKASFLEKQKPIAEKILAYDWTKAIKVYAENLGLV